MNQRLRNELSFLALLAVPFFLRRDSKKTAGALLATSVALRFLPAGAKYSFVNKHVVITGGSRGLGLAIARRFLIEGARLTLIARDEEELRRANLRLKSAFPQSEIGVIACDVTVESEITQAIQDAHHARGWIDVFVNNAGAIMASPFEVMDAADFRAQMDLHLNAVVSSTHILAKYFHVRGEGRIVNISSIGGKIALPHMAAYTASKFALAGFSRAVASELAKYNIKVTTVYPGLMRTGSTIQAVFKGDQEKEFAVFSAMDLLPGISMKASKAARKIVEACREGDVEAVIGFPAKFGAFMYENFPEITGLAAKFAAGLLPEGHSRERKTGAESQSLFQSLAVTKPLREMDARAQAELNQQQKTDAGFNLGAGHTTHTGEV